MKITKELFPRFEEKIEKIAENKEGLSQEEVIRKIKTIREKLAYRKEDVLQEYEDTIYRTKFEVLRRAGIEREEAEGLLGFKKESPAFEKFSTVNIEFNFQDNTGAFGGNDIANFSYGLVQDFEGNWSLEGINSSISKEGSIEGENKYYNNDRDRSIPFEEHIMVESGMFARVFTAVNKVAEVMRNKENRDYVESQLFEIKENINEINNINGLLDFANETIRKLKMKSLPPKFNEEQAEFLIEHMKSHNDYVKSFIRFSPSTEEEDKVFVEHKSVEGFLGEVGYGFWLNGKSISKANLLKEIQGFTPLHEDIIEEIKDVEIMDLEELVEKIKLKQKNEEGLKR